MSQSSMLYKIIQDIIISILWKCNTSSLNFFIDFSKWNIRLALKSKNWGSPLECRTKHTRAYWKLLRFTWTGDDELLLIWRKGANALALLPGISTTLKQRASGQSCVRAPAWVAEQVPELRPGRAPARAAGRWSSGPLLGDDGNDERVVRALLLFSSRRSPRGWM